MRFNTILATIVLVTGSCGIHAQTPFTYQRGVPTTNGSPAVAKTCYRGLSGTGELCVSPPNSVSSATLTLPQPTGSSGCWNDNGAGVTTIASCAGLTPPVTISGSISGDILTLTQSGSGRALTVNGPAAIGGSTTGDILDITQSGSGNALVALGPSSVQDNSSGNTAWSITQLGTGDALHITGNSKVTGFFSQASNLWSFNLQGLAFAQDYTARYVFNSIGDVPQTGTFTSSGTAMTFTSGTNDTSWVGGQILLCNPTCTGANGTLFSVSAWVDSTHLTLGSAPGFNGQYSYQANAFQTSQGTMYITGSGFGYLQNVVVTNGFTSVGGGSASGVVNTSGTSVTWTSGSKFNLSMAGGQITINSVLYGVSAVPTDHNITLTASAGTQFGVAYSYISNAFQISSGGASIDNLGNGTLKSLQVGLTQLSPTTTTFSGRNTFSGASVFNGSVSGTHGQSFGTADFMTLAGASLGASGLSVTGNTALGALSAVGTTISGAATFSSTTSLNGTVNGTHGQNVGIGDSPSFAGLTDTGTSTFTSAATFNGGIVTGSSTSSTFYVGSGNFYLRTFSGAPSCGGVTDGWAGFDTTTVYTPTLTAGTLWICNGGVATAH